MNAFTKTVLATGAAVALAAVAVTGPADASSHRGQAHPGHKSHAPKASAAGVTVDEGAGTATVTVTLDKKAKKRLRLNWTTRAGHRSAKAGEDFTAVRGRLVLAPGTTRADLVVPILDDSEVEGTEFFYVTFNGKAVKVRSPRVRVTIADDDVAPAPAS